MQFLLPSTVDFSVDLSFFQEGDHLSLTEHLSQKGIFVHNAVRQDNSQGKTESQVRKYLGSRDVVFVRIKKRIRFVRPHTKYQSIREYETVLGTCYFILKLNYVR